VSDANPWLALGEAEPGRSERYVERIRAMAAAGDDLGGEARFVDAMAPRGARILDAGCGPGRCGAALAACGHDVVGIDLDPVFVAAARADHPDGNWIHGDLATFDPAAHGVDTPFDVIVAAGNVMPFLAPDTRAAVLANFRRWLSDGGRAVVGFGSDRGYPFAEFFVDATVAGLAVDARFATWDLRPFGDDAAWLVAVLSPV
jgi:SAM-dependent methyltransferase